MRKKIEIDTETLIEAYKKSGRSLRKTAKILGTSEKTIQRRLKEINYNYESKKKYFCNEQFFDKLDEKSLYWLGFLATDGNISFPNELRFGLAIKDRAHLIKFKIDINSNSPIHDYIAKRNNEKFKKSEYPYSTISISSKKICDKLAEYNIVPAKTYTYEFPNQLLNTPEVRHFIRGCIDGDGSEGLRFNKENNPCQARVSMSGNPKFVNQVFDLIKEKCHLSKDSGTFYSEDTWAKFEFAGHEDILKIKDFLYKDATVFLERKYKNISRIDDIIENSKLFIVDSQILQNKYNELGSFAAVAKEFDVCNSTIKRKMDKLNLEYKDLSQMKHNENIFGIEHECEKQFYLAGYLATKSSIRIYSENKQSITISNKNKDEIGFIKNLMETDAIINGDSLYNISLFNKKIISDLVRFGINSNKLKEYSIPNWIVNHNAINHFVRGCLDGKSCLSDKSQLILEITGPLGYLSDIKNIFIDKCNLTSTNEIRSRKNKDSHRLTYSGNSVIKIAQFLYKDATIFLPRKREIIQHLL